MPRAPRAAERDVVVTDGSATTGRTDDDQEEAVVRPYVLVEDIEAAVESARAAGAEIAVPPMEIPGRGRCAVYFLGGNQYGLWQR